MNPDHLIDLAEGILRSRSGYPRQAEINRAISTAYYALFHALAWLCVRSMVGSPDSPRHWEIVAPVFRAIDHFGARKVFARLAADGASSETMKRISRSFLEVQAGRIAADYDPDPKAVRHVAKPWT